jgi:hypothetical protein
MRTPIIVISIMVAATGGTVAALVVGMGPVADGGADRPAPAVVIAPADEPVLANTIGAPASADADELPAEPEPAGIHAKLASPPVFIKGQDVTWASVKEGMRASSIKATEADGKCLNEKDVDRAQLPETGVVDLKFVGGGPKPRRIQVFGKQFDAAPVAFECFKQSLKGVEWEAEGDAKVHIRLSFQYG